MIEVTVRCGCTRTMRADGAAGGRYLCGCGASVTLAGLPKRDAMHCPMLRGNRICNGPKIADQAVCQPCAVMISRLALADPEVVEQVGASGGLSEFYRARDAETERLREQDRARIAAAELRDDARKYCVVYYCRVRPGVVKIGTSMQLGVRMDSFRVASADVLAAEPGSFKVENMRHKQFAHLRIDPRREDFRLGDDLQAHIETVRGNFGDPFEFVSRMIERQRERLAKTEAQS